MNTLDERSLDVTTVSLKCLALALHSDDGLSAAEVVERAAAFRAFIEETEEHHREAALACLRHASRPSILDALAPSAANAQLPNDTDDIIAKADIFLEFVIGSSRPERHLHD